MIQCIIIGTAAGETAAMKEAEAEEGELWGCGAKKEGRTITFATSEKSLGNFHPWRRHSGRFPDANKCEE